MRDRDCIKKRRAIKNNSDSESEEIIRASLHVSVGKETSQGVQHEKLVFALSCGLGGWGEIQ